MIHLLVTTVVGIQSCLGRSMLWMAFFPSEMALSIHCRQDDPLAASALLAEAVSMAAQWAVSWDMSVSQSRGDVASSKAVVARVRSWGLWWLRVRG